MGPSQQKACDEIKDMLTKNPVQTPMTSERPKWSVNMQVILVPVVKFFNRRTPN